MQRRSSIHIDKGNPGFLSHNDRSRPTKNSIFTDEPNEVSHDHKTAFSIYRKELSKRSAAYTARTGQKLQAKTVTHLSAVINLEKHHSLNDLKPLIDHLEKTLDTKVFQVSIHRDEGHIDDEGKPVKNYHAHVEFMGIDSQGKSVRRKLTRSYLRNLQSKTAEILKMERGDHFSTRKRLDTYQYKEAKKREEVTVKALKKEIAELRQKMIDVGEFTKEDYQALSKIKQMTRKSTLAEAVKEFEKFQNRVEKLVEEIEAREERKDREIERLKSENEELQQAKIELLELKPTFNSFKEQKQKEIEALAKEKEEEQKRRKKAEEEAERLRKEVYSDKRFSGTKKPVPWKFLAEHYLKQLKEEQKRRREVEERAEQAAAYQQNDEIEELEAENKELRAENRELRQENIKLKEYIYEIAKAAGVGIMNSVENVVKNTVSSIKSLFSRVSTLEAEKQELEERIEELDGYGYGGGFKL